MDIINIMDNEKFLNEYIKICSLEWDSLKSKEQIQQHINIKKNKIITGDKVISILGLIENDKMLGFISLFKYDGEERRDLTPWYATMYVKKEYRNKGYSKILNDAVLKEALRLGYSQVYLKTNLINYYEKFGAKYIDKLSNGEKLYYIKLDVEELK